MMQKKEAYLTTSYLPTIQYISKFILCEKIYLEAHENYQAQSYRNRAVISSPNGIQTLSIPVKNKATNIKDVRIDYISDWQKIHWRSIENSYKSSPFFEFYADAFLPFFNKRYDFLWDLNLNLLHTILDEIEIPKAINLTESFKKNTPYWDYRFSIHPKKKHQKQDPDFNPKPYIQVFSDRFDFIPNLSIIDLIFNKGPETYLHLQRCATK